MNRSIRHLILRKRTNYKPPTTNLLVWLRRPNYGNSYILPQSCLDILGNGSYFNNDTPIPVNQQAIINSKLTNKQGGKVFFSKRRDLLVYSETPDDYVEQELWTFLFGTIFSQIIIDNQPLLIDGIPLYIGI